LTPGCLSAKVRMKQRKFPHNTNVNESDPISGFPHCSIQAGGVKELLGLFL
jgi:hypothetical protein